MKSGDHELLELAKLHRTAQDKYTYFLLAAAVSAIAFSVQKSDGLMLSKSLMPLGLAVLSWLLSTYYGCKYLLLCQNALAANFNLTALQTGRHTEQPDSPESEKIAIEVTRQAIKEISDEAEHNAKWQFIYLISGVILFVIWHLLEMIIRTYS